ncbi:hypothetical protein BC343_16585 [Mucilaginibacter pedocola]|uniref:Uncharacterized protein n=2 Tax=Mucilaginibacter pedocola TaxID=1792845 RepID=A0A1S9P856_9SPHI|nr:hypothetical protein BC343_16585 [Mucilaginibacter pedocola]
MYVISRNKGDETCMERITILREVIVKKDSLIVNWQNKYINLSTALLYKNNIIDRQNKLIQNTDSLARVKFEKPAKQIVKENE